MSKTVHVHTAASEDAEASPRRVAVQVETETVEVRSVAYVETSSNDQQRLIDFIWTVKNWVSACAMMNITTEKLACLKPEHLMMLHDAARALVAAMEPLTKPLLTLV